MKNQYFGDISDYMKYGLLRSIQSATDFNILVAWMLTPDDESTDGEIIEYLSQPEQWQKYDPLLYRELVRLLGENENRKVSLIEGSKVLDGFNFFSNIVPDSRMERGTWFSSLLKTSIQNDLVFLDPDNGLEVKSKPYGRKYSSKFLFWHEVVELWKSGKSLLIYQHFIRENREKYTQRTLMFLQENTPNSHVLAFSTSRVLFVLALQPKHFEFIEPIIKKVQSSWKSQINFSELNDSKTS